MKAHGTVFKYGDNVDTDVIIPARYLNSSDPAELATHCMEDIDTDFVKKVQKGDIIVQVGDMKIETSTQYMMAVRQYLVDKTVTVTVLRPSQEAFQKMSFEMMLGTKE